MRVSASTLLAALLQKVSSLGAPSHSRLGDTREILSAGFALPDARDCLLSDSIQQSRRGALAVRIVQNLGGYFSAAELLHHEPSIQLRLDPGTGLYDGAYGPRLLSRMRAALATSCADSATRRSVVPVIQPEDDPSRIDFPSILALQFLQRAETLQGIVYARSIDALNGLPIDLPLFAALLCTMAQWTGLPPGSITFLVGSLHLYERDLDLSRDVALRLSEPVPCELLPSFEGLHPDATAELCYRVSCAETIMRGACVSSHPIGEPTPATTPLEEWLLSCLRAAHVQHQTRSSHQ